MAKAGPTPRERAPKKTGRPPLDIPAEDIEKMAGYGCTLKEMADFYGCSVETICNRFSNELQRGRASGKTRLRMLQWQAAEQGSDRILVWLGKQLLKQSEAPVDEEGKPTEVRRIVFDAGAVDEEYKAKVHETLAEVDRQIANSATEELPASESD